MGELKALARTNRSIRIDKGDLKCKFKLIGIQR